MRNAQIFIQNAVTDKAVCGNLKGTAVFTLAETGRKYIDNLIVFVFMQFIKYQAGRPLPILGFGAGCVVFDIAAGIQICNFYFGFMKKLL